MRQECRWWTHPDFRRHRRDRLGTRPELKLWRRGIFTWDLCSRRHIPPLDFSASFPFEKHKVCKSGELVFLADVGRELWTNNGSVMQLLRLRPHCINTIVAECFDALLHDIWLVERDGSSTVKLAVLFHIPEVFGRAVV
jgi:hypothetical protein